MGSWDKETTKNLPFVKIKRERFQIARSLNFVFSGFVSIFEIVLMYLFVIK